MVLKLRSVDTVSWALLSVSEYLKASLSRSSKMLLIILRLYSNSSFSVALKSCYFCLSQVEPSKPDILVPYSLNRPASTKRHFLCHCRTPGVLLGDPAASYQTLPSCSAGTVSLFSWLNVQSHTNMFHFVVFYWPVDFPTLFSNIYPLWVWKIIDWNLFKWLWNWVKEQMSESKLNLLFRELEKQRESSASDIAKKKQEAEAAVSS